MFLDKATNDLVMISVTATAKHLVGAEAKLLPLLILASE